MIKSFRDLIVWQKAHQFVLEVYKITAKFPNDEKYALTSQIRNAVVSIAANIVEGFKRKHNKDYARFLNISEGSLEEVKYYLILSLDLDYLNKDEYDNLWFRAEEIGKMLNSFIKKLNP